MGNDTTIKIDKGVPVPSAGHKNKYPFKDMEPGDSFFVSTEGQDKGNTRNRIQSCACRFAKMQNPRQQFCSRQTDDGIRCWRVF